MPKDLDNRSSEAEEKISRARGRRRRRWPGSDELGRRTPQALGDVEPNFGRMVTGGRFKGGESSAFRPGWDIPGSGLPGGSATGIQPVDPEEAAAAAGWPGWPGTGAPYAPVQLPPWTSIPWEARRFQTPRPPYRTTIPAGGTVTIVDLQFPEEKAAIIETLEMSIEEAVGLPIVTVAVTRSGIPIPEVGVGFTLDHPFSYVIAEDIRLLNGSRFIITATNPGIVAFHTFTRVRGYTFNMNKFGKNLTASFQ